jgi:hypothetical protein
MTEASDPFEAYVKLNASTL